MLPRISPVPGARDSVSYGQGIRGDGQPPVHIVGGRIACEYGGSSKCEHGMT
jgi:hypothetical protein